MSAQATPVRSEEPGQAVGSPPDVQTPDDGGAGASGEGASPEPEQKDGGVQPSSDDDREALRAELAAVKADQARMLELISSDPELSEAVIAKAQGREKPGAAKSRHDRLDEVLRKNFGGDANDPLIRGLREVLGVVIEDAEQGAVARVEPGIRSLQSVAAVTTFERTLGDNGVDAAVAATPAFQSHLRSLQTDAEFKRLSPAYAAKLAAKTWDGAVRAKNGADARRLADAKGANAMNKGTPRGSAGVGDVHLLPRGAGMLERLKLIKQGVSPDRIRETR